MLNAVLVEMLIAVHRTRRTGLLVLDSTNGRRGLGFANGELVAVQMSNSKNQLIVDTLLRMHRLSHERHLVACESLAIAADPLPNLISDGAITSNDIDQATQALVEEELVAMLATTGQPEFLDQSPDQLDYSSTALRLRIDPQTLIRTAGARVAEDLAVTEAIGGPQSVFALNETAGSGLLSDEERNILNLVDGQRSVEELAEAAKISNAHMGRVLRGLLSRGVIRRVADKGTRTIRNFTPVVPMDRRNDVVGGTTVRRRSPVVMIGLASLLVVVALVWWLVADYQKKSGELQKKIDTVITALAAKEWVGARTALGDAAGFAGDDIAAKRRVKAAGDELTVALVKERQRIANAIAQRAFAGLRDAVNRLPESDERSGLQQSLIQAEDTFQQTTSAIDARVQMHLNAGHLIAAAAELATQPQPERDRGEQRLAAERVAKLEMSRTRAAPFAIRTEALTQVAGANPTATQLEQIAEISAELKQAKIQTQRQLDELSLRAGSGDVAGVRDTIKREDLARLTGNSDLFVYLTRIETMLSACDDELHAARSTLEHYLSGDPEASATAAYKALNGALDRYPQHPIIPTLNAGLMLAKAIERESATTTIEQELPTLRERLEKAGEFKPQIEARMARFNQYVQTTNSMLETAIEAQRTNLALAESRLLELIAHPMAARTAIMREAVARLSEVREQQKRRQMLAKDLEAAMARNDIAAAVRIAQDMGQRHLPVRVESLPLGATVAMGNTVLGVTPLVMELDGLERTQTTFTLTLPGYEPLALPGKDAEGGWRVAGVLNRRIAKSVATGELITTAPTVSGADVYVASRVAAWRIRADNVSSIPLDRSGSLEAQAMTAPPTLTSDGWWFITPEGAAWNLRGDAVQRFVLSSGTRLAPAATTSEIIADRHWLFLAGDNRISGFAPGRPGGWSGPTGAGFISPPLVARDQLLIARSDGVLEALSTEDGTLRSATSTSVGEPVLFAWIDGESISGITQTRAFSWHGGQPAFERLPSEAVGAGQDVYIGVENRVWLRQNNTWRESGRLPQAATKPPLAWNNHVVAVCGDRVQVIGTRSFSHAAKVQIAGIAIAGKQLVIADVSGLVTFYDP